MDSNPDEIGSVEENEKLRSNNRFVSIIVILLMLAGVGYFISSQMRAGAFISSKEAASPKPTSNQKTELSDSNAVLDAYYPVATFSFTPEEWLDNLNAWNTKVGNPLIEADAIEINSDSVYAHPSASLFYCALLDSDGRIFSVFIRGSGDGTDNTANALLGGIDGLIASIHPDYTTSQRDEIVKSLGDFTDIEAPKTFTRKDNTHYSFSSEAGFMSLVAFLYQ